jgi:hypothetical protein
MIGHSHQPPLKTAEVEFLRFHSIFLRFASAFALRPLAAVGQTVLIER